MRALTTTGWTVDQTSYRLLRDVLRPTVHAGSGAAERDGPIRCRASAVLYLLLLDISSTGGAGAARAGVRAG